jgi:hypothetical protein
MSVANELRGCTFRALARQIHCGYHGSGFGEPACYRQSNSLTGARYQRYFSGKHHRPSIYLHKSEYFALGRDGKTTAFFHSKGEAFWL